MKNKPSISANKTNLPPKPAVREMSKLDELQKMEEAFVKRAERLERKFKRRYRMLYALLTFIGIVFLWYGAWTIISEIPILNNPYVASGLGIVILLLLGQFYDNMISANDRRMKKPPVKKP